MHMNFKDVKKVFYRGQEIKAIKSGENTLWESFKKVTYPCDLIGIDLDVLDKDSPKFNEDLAIATWFVHRQVFKQMNYMPQNPGQVNTLKEQWNSDYTQRVVPNLLYCSHTMQLSVPYNQNGFWYATGIPANHSSYGSGGITPIGSDKPHSKLVNMVSWTPNGSNEGRKGVCTKILLQYEKKYVLYFWYKIEGNIPGNIAFDVYTGAGSIPNSDYNPGDTITMGTKEIVSVPKSEIITDGKWHRYRLEFDGKPAGLQGGQSSSIIGVLFPINVKFSLAGLCLKIKETDNDGYTEGRNYDPNASHCFPDETAFLDAILDKNYFENHAHKIIAICDYLPPSNPRICITDLHKEVEKRIYKLDEDLPRITRWYKSLSTKNIQGTPYVSWLGQQGNDFNYTWKYEYNGNSYPVPHHGLLVTHDRISYLPDGSRTVLLELKWDSIKESSSNWSDYGNLTMGLHHSMNLFTQNNLENAGIVLLIKYENLLPKEWLDSPELKSRYLVEYKPGKFGLRFDVADVMTAYNQWVSNMASNITYKREMKYIILDIVGENGSWSFSGNYPILNWGVVKNLMLPWASHWAARNKLVLPKYPVEADTYGLNAFVNPYFGNIDKINKWLEDMKKGGVDSQISGMSKVSINGKTGLLMCSVNDGDISSLVDLPDSKIKELVEYIKENKILFYGPVTKKEIEQYKDKLKPLINHPLSYKLHISQIRVTTLERGVQGSKAPKLRFEITAENKGTTSCSITSINIVNTGALFSANNNGNIASWGGEVIIAPGSNHTFQLNDGGNNIFPKDHQGVFRISIKGAPISYGEGGAAKENIDKLAFNGYYSTKELEGSYLEYNGFPIHLHDTEELKNRR